MFNDVVFNDVVNRQARPSSDLERVQRIGARFLGAGVVAYLVVSWPVLTANLDYTSPWWPPLSVVLAVGPAVVLMVASFRPGVGWLGPSALLASAGYLLAVVLWFPAWTGQSLPDPTESAVWLQPFPGMAAMVLMLVYPHLGVGHLVVTTVAVNVAQQLGRFGSVNGDLLFEILWAVGFSGVFLAIAVVAARTGRVLDQTRAGAHQTAAAAAAATARTVEQARFDAVIHDRAIASLLAVEPGRPDARLAEQSRSALDVMDDLAAGTPAPTTEVPVSTALRRIRGAAGDLGDDIEVDVAGSAELTSDYPAEVVEAIIEAMSEAIRNARRHAGPDASCAVLCRASSDSISMAVVDDGIGFAPDSIAVGRLGIQASIRGRMRGLVGGSADVHSVPGRGTTIQIQWVRS